jgi:hypothetical protein
MILSTKQIAKKVINLFGGNYRIIQDQKPIFKKEPDIENLLVIEDIKDYLKNCNKPFMIGRWGTTESDLLRHYLGLISKYEKKYNKKIKKNIKNKCGMFSNDKKSLEKYGKMYKKATKSADLMRMTDSIHSEKKMIAYIDKNKKITSSGIIPWKQNSPWTKYLKNKKILVFSPFKKDIIEQYEKRKSLFENDDVLPNFDLRVIRALNTRGGNNRGFDSWFEALDHQKKKISSIDFDIALLACGSYGMPLCKFIKEELKKSSIYMASSLQLLFGLKGKRWEGKKGVENMYNDKWKYPSDNVVNPSSISEDDYYGK